MTHTHSPAVREFSNTCCLIDFDGTLANSLVWYNKALDAMFMGKVTDKHYIEYYKDFGDAYEIIPGSPWKSILMNLCRYLAPAHPVSVETAWDDNNVVKTSAGHDLGVIDTMLKVAYDLEFVSYNEHRDIAVYANATEAVSVVLGAIACIEDVLFTNEAAIDLRKNEYRILVPSGYVGMTREQIERFGEAFFYVEDMANKLEGMFNDHACRILADAPYEELAIAPVIDFCRSFKEQGGTIAIHSGSNKRIIETMMDVLSIRDLFDFYLCSDMLSDIDVNELGAWGYKTELIGRLLSRYPKEKWDTFVVGDTKGDAFGAYENNEPFVLVWRGYPSDPAMLSSSDGTLVVQDFADIRQEVLDASRLGDAAAQEATAQASEHLMQYARSAASGAAVPIAKIDTPA